MRLVLLAFIGVVGLASPGFAQALQRELSTNAPGSSDHVVPRYAGSTIMVQTRKDFDELTLPLGAAIGSSYQTDADKKLRYAKGQSVEGRLTRTVYAIPEGRSTLEVVRNYSGAMGERGAKALFECSKTECGEEFHKLHHSVARQLKPEGTAYTRERRDLTRAVLEYVDPGADQRLWVGQWTKPDGGQVYMVVYAATQTGGSLGNVSDALKGRVYALVEVLETGTMQRNLEFVSAQQMSGALGKDGRVALYGIYFDFDKAEPKRESDKQLAEMAALLKAEPTLKVYIVGHTDNKGALAYNVDLSTRRAQSVATALSTRYGVGADRMVGRGIGPLAPLAPNDTEDGQAKNRRVELVRQ